METLRKILMIVSMILLFLSAAICCMLLFRYLDIEKKYDYLVTEREERETALLQARAAQQQAESESARLTEQLGQMQAELDGLYLRIEELNNQTQTGSEMLGQSLQPGSVIMLPEGDISLDNYFYASPIEYGSDVFQRINGKSYRENNDIMLDDLRYLRLLHYNFQHEVQVGEMIVNRQIAEDTLSIFKELFEAEYEIQSIRLIDDYWTGDGVSTDTASIEQNNTSCFNYRAVTGGETLSNHAYGCAIDINPQQNPYVWREADGSLAWTHSNASSYIDRNSGLPHVIVAGDICCSIFEKYGFRWGGYWDNPTDYQHFERPLYSG